MLKVRVKTIAVATISVVAGLTPMAIRAQTQPQPAHGGDQVEEVEVTAQKRVERIQDVPITMQAFSANTLANAGISNSTDIAALVPGLVFNQSIVVGIPSLRGVNHNTSAVADESPVAMFIDGVYVPNNVDSIFSLADVEQVEVLKGPQGTLFGRNATAGVISVVTRDPQQEPRLDASLGYANFDTVQGTFYGTVGVTDNLATDLSIYGRYQGLGYGKNITLDIPAWFNDDFTIRNKWLLTPDDKTKVKVIASYGVDDGTSAYGVAPGATSTDHITRYISFYDVANDIPTNYQNYHYGVSAQVDRDINWAHLVNITAYQDMTSRYGFDQTASTGAPCGASCAAVNTLGDTPTHTWTEEFRIASPDELKIKWVGGFYFLNDHSVGNIDIFGNFGTGAVPQRLQGVVDTTSYAGFAQSTATILPSTRLTLGIRYTADHRDFSGQDDPLPGLPNSVTVLPVSTATSVPSDLPASKSWDRMTYRASLDYDLAQDVLAYVEFNTGYKSGTYNISSLTNPPVAPETLTSYEAGIKSELWDKRLRFNIAGFLYDYDNIQLRAYAPNAPGVIFLYNAAKSQIYGSDIDFQAVLGGNFSVVGGMEYLHARYTDAPSVPITTQLPSGLNATSTGSATGHVMTRAPTFTGSIGPQYDVETDGGNYSVNVTYSYDSGFYWDPDNRVKQPAYSNLNASVKWTAPSMRWDIRLWGTNLTNVHRYAGYNELAVDTYQPAPPLLFGLTVGVHLD